MSSGKNEKEISLKVRNKWVKYSYQVDVEKGVLLLKDLEDGELVKTIKVLNCDFLDACKSQKEQCCIRVVSEGEGDSFIFRAEDLKTIDEFKADLEEVGGSFEGLEIEKRSKSPFGCCLTDSSVWNGPSRMEPSNSNSNEQSINQSNSIRRKSSRRISNINVNNWTKQDALLWLEEIGMKESSCEKVFRENDIDGDIIIACDSSILSNLGVKKKDIDKIIPEIERLKELKIFLNKI